jgi:nuclear transport factor 2 (NTF2) superfamily protein
MMTALCTPAQRVFVTSGFDRQQWLCHCADSDWRNRDEFFVGREKIREFLIRKWQKEHDYRLKVQI